MADGWANTDWEKYAVSNEFSAHVSDASAGSQTITFYAAMEAILTLDKDGMIYKDQRIEDAGEAYRAFMEVMGMMRIGSDG